MPAGALVRLDDGRRQLKSLRAARTGMRRKRQWWVVEGRSETYTGWEGADARRSTCEGEQS